MDKSPTKSICQPARFALLWMHLANEPFVALLTLLGFMIKKELGASTFELSLLGCLHPVLSCLSFYLSTLFSPSSHRLIPNLMLSFFLGRILFIFLPFYSSVWFVILAASLYQLFNRASTPTLVEIIKSTIDEKKQPAFFSSVYFFNFLESIGLGLLLGKLLDLDKNHWKWAISFAALFSLTSLVFHRKIQLKNHSPPKISITSWSTPFKLSFLLMKTSKAFALFQLGFMVGGIGLMLMNPALIVFYTTFLKLSHETLMNARYLWMGIGVLSTTYLWQKHLSRQSIFFLIGLITLGFGLFAQSILLSLHSFSFFYIGFVIYGIAQAGSHLVWHLSGILFSKPEESSSLYTATNVLMVGIRGVFAPLLGGLLTTTYGASFTLKIGSLVCFLGSFLMLYVFFKLRRHADEEEEDPQLTS